MILCLDVGNSQVYGGVFVDGILKMQFRRTTQQGSSSDELGLFLRGVLRENNLDPSKIQQIAICSVVPNLVYSLRNACKKYFDVQPFLLRPGVKTGLKIKYRNPLEVGADRIANAIAATNLFPQQNLIVIDLGTATTFCVISKDKEYLGGAIVAGLKMSMEALEERTAKLPSVEILAAPAALGRSTVESIQIGLYLGHIGEMREISGRITQEAFSGQKPLIIGTGGFSVLFEDAKIFDKTVPTLVLQGLYQALKMNESQKDATLPYEEATSEVLV